jgi:phosphocarrier protein
MTQSRIVRIVNPQGLHARPISLLVASTRRFKARVRIRAPDGTEADASSVFSLMTLAATQGTELTVEGDGDEAADAVQAIVNLVESGFGEA